MTTMSLPPANTIGVQSYTETYPSAPDSARRARLLVSAALHAWDMGDLVDSAMLVVSELVGNSVRHTSCRLLRVTVSRPGPTRAEITVTDRSRTTPTMTRSAADAEEGRGLVLVDALSERWGCDLHRWGKTVWAEVAAC
ncbi:ATP-binding protein [Streptomyces sp. FIT100]|uniref:ATP-binding protein n=1 Tax=Streptomyces sp. FIT100 TaxID=2837956 RepID=UPI0021C9859F|nr:ATP-binding protein [Streptomyces sp. FIT100]UUN26599.1 ATP-binding protein [Streptomyces sp. FIT100]